MAFIFTCGTHTFTSLLEGYENVTCQCQNCGNFSGRVFKRWSVQRLEESFKSANVIQAMVHILLRGMSPFTHPKQSGSVGQRLNMLQPIIPFSLKPWHEIGCHICNFYQDIKYAYGTDTIMGEANAE